jgi:tetratricopeptide (TPR) repeat protein
MGIIDKLFGRNKPTKNIEGSENDEMIRAYDNQGHDILIPRKDYREKVLPGQFKEAWNNPEALYGAIVMALNDHFYDDCLKPAEHLHQIDRNPERSTTILAIVNLKIGRYKESKNLLESFIQRHGKSGVILTNLAKVYAELKNEQKSQQTLFEALQVDPNQDNALDWWGVIQREKGGDPAFLEAMKQIASVKGSWRPQLWIARALLEQKQIQEALEIYEKALVIAHDEPDALMMITGDLGNNGYIKEMLAVAGPIYSPEVHGPMAGLNFAQACIALKKVNEGLRYCSLVEKLERYDLKKHVDDFKSQLYEIKASA